MPAFYSVALLIAFYALVVAEILIPSGGLLAISAAVVAVTSVIIGFTYSAFLGLTLTLVYLVTTPILFAALVKLWPKTRIGRSMLNRDTLESSSELPEPTTIDGTALTEFIGQTGVATSNLLPSGQVKIAGHKSDAISTGLPIDAGSIIVVTRVHSAKLQVRHANDQEREAYQPPQSTPPTEVEFRPAEFQTTEPQHETPTATSNVANNPAPSSGASPLDDIDFDELTTDEPTARSQ